ncbi:WxL protein peptidoglycan domain-containing protein [Plantactinospora sp. WMMC1484]|uniref:WxL protein peptidoglycan domain-containing protein n=1 Tax=Plantactinospora sp. WMMC1484 TaxID=3404122 RepID=UPI003BF60711
MRLPTSIAAVVAGAVSALVLGAVPAAAAPTPTPTPTPSGSVPARPAPVTWGVTPSSPTGPNGRASFGYKLDPGARVTDYVAVTNHSARPLTLSLYASDAVTTPQGGFDLLPGGQRPVDVGSWVRLTAPTLTIPSTSRMDVPFTLTVPENATPGDHVGGIVASLAATTTDGQGNQVAVDHRVGARIYLRVTGELRPALALEGLRVDHRASGNPFAGGEIVATATIRNTGNVRLAGQPMTESAGLFGLGRRSASGTALPEILPGGAVRTTVRLRGVAPLFRLTVTTTVVPAAVEGQALDPHPAEASEEVTVWAVPWRQLLLVLLVLGAVGALLMLRRRRRRRAARNLAQAVAAAREQGRAEATATAAGTPSGPPAGTGPPTQPDRSTPKAAAGPPTSTPGAQP